MLIAFWGAGPECGTTFHMLAVREQLKAMCKTKMERSGISFVDCGHRRDRKTREILTRAELVVVNLNPETRILDHFFLYDIHLAGSADKLLFLIGCYCGSPMYERKWILRDYRMGADRLGVIPCNSEFEQAAGNGNIVSFMKVLRTQPLCERNRCFFTEIRHFTILLVQMISNLRGEWNANDLRLKKGEF